MTHMLRCFAGVAALLVSAAPAAAAPPVRAVAQAKMLVVDAHAGTGQPVEQLAFSRELRRGLDRLARGGVSRLAVADWPTAPGKRLAVTFERQRVYAPGAKVWVATARGLREAPRSAWTFLVGKAAEDSSARILLAVDPKRGLVEGVSLGAGGTHQLQIADGGEYRLMALVEPDAGDEPNRTCGTTGIPGPTGIAELDGRWFAALQEQVRYRLDAGAAVSSLTELHEAVIAWDTDNELLNRKFANNTTNATNYIASLTALISVIYERDLFVQLLQGDTILRPSTTPDPYVQPCGAGVTDCSSNFATDAMLNELEAYWDANYDAFPRALTQLLSGKQHDSSFSSGIGNLGGLCSTSNGYAVTQVFRSPGSPASNDVYVTAHEVGHVFGAPHTHCAGIDSCYDGEEFLGCYGGTPTCPAPFTIDPINGAPVNNVRGTLMSYCHFGPPNGPGSCTGSTQNIFHPTTVANLDPFINNAIGVCIEPLAILEDGFELGNTSRWDEP
jgi:hypothetical protein